MSAPYVGWKTVDERLAMPRVPWRSFTDAELEQVAAAAYLYGDTKTLTAVRRVVRARDLDPRPRANRS